MIHTQQEIKPRAQEMDRTGEIPSALIRTMGEMGLLGLPFPEQYGGAGADFLSYCMAIEEISRGDASVGITMEAHTSLGASSIYLFGSEEQKQRFLVPLFFEDCVVPAENILGRRGDGFKQFMQILDGGRVAIAALSVGLAQACLDEALSYAKQRRQFGQPISKFQAIQFKRVTVSSLPQNEGKGHISFPFCRLSRLTLALQTTSADPV